MIDGLLDIIVIDSTSQNDGYIHLGSDGLTQVPVVRAASTTQFFGWKVGVATIQQYRIDIGRNSNRLVHRFAVQHMNHLHNFDMGQLVSYLRISTGFDLIQSVGVMTSHTVTLALPRPVGCCSGRKVLLPTD